MTKEEFEDRFIDRIKCITFDQKAQENLPESVKLKMSADREKARLGWKQAECINCRRISWCDPEDKDGIILGYCEHCGHPIWEDPIKK